MSVNQSNLQNRSELLLLVAFCGFLFFYGLGAFGLVGADEPRYAQIAREMLDRSDWITPTLNGKPWLEKPPLYYWQAMVTYRVARVFLPANDDGVNERTARIPSAIDAAILVAAVYWFLRRFWPGTETDGALTTASCAGIIGFAHAAATDMPLAATFTIALLGWYVWYEKRERVGLILFYLFLALGMLAKGPVAPSLAAVIVILFAAIRRDWKCLLPTLWLPGIALFLIVALPWYIAVQIRNPEFFRFFILEHNLARFSTNVYHHPQPFWFYVPVFLLAVMPWTVWLVLAVYERLQPLWSRGAEKIGDSDEPLHLFLIVWMLVPILFFSLSQSKLPGYILPSVPAAALLVTIYLAERRENEMSVPWAVAAVHGIVCALVVFAALSAGSIAISHHLAKGSWTNISAGIALIIALGIMIAIASNSGLRLVRSATLLAVIVSVAAVIRFAAPAIDATQSARPLARTILGFSAERVPVALYHVSRVEGYGLEFYLNHPVQKYDDGEVPLTAHVLVAASGTGADLRARLNGRKVSYLTSLPAQKLDLYWVANE